MRSTEAEKAMSTDGGTVEEFKTVVAELRALIVAKLAELEEDPNWGSADEMSWWFRLKH